MKSVEQQVTCLELSIELRDNGYLQEGLWCQYEAFVMNGKRVKLLCFDLRLTSSVKFPLGSGERIIIRPTCAELGERLPSSVIVDDVVRHLTMIKEPNLYAYSYGLREHRLENWIVDNIEANAMAKLWLYLNKEGLLK